jgi:hypothetical protein
MIDDAERDALAQVLAPAHRKLRRGNLDPDLPGQPSALCYAIADALLAQRIVNVRIETSEATK